MSSLGWLLSQLFSPRALLDVLVVGTDGKPARPWLTTIIDDCSRAICGYTAFLGAPVLGLREGGRAHLGLGTQ